MMINYASPGFLFFLLLFLAVPFGSAQTTDETAEKISLRVDFTKKEGPMNPIWAWWGYDEPNYTYMEDGKKLNSEIADLSPVPVYQLWLEMGSPQNPTEDQVKKLEEAGHLELLNSPKWLKTTSGNAVLNIQLPRQGVSLLKMDWKAAKE